MPRLLSLGSGKDVRPGWVRLDGDPEVRPDIIASVPPLPREVLALRWDVIELNHFLASLWAWEATELLKQIWQVLKPGGKVVIETPDIAFCARHLIMHDTKGDSQNHYYQQYEEPPSTTGSWEEGQLSVRGFYGNPNSHNKFESNKWGYYPRSLRRLLVDCGFDEAGIVELPAQYHVPVRDFRMEATR